MIRHLVSMTTMAAVCLAPMAPAVAQSYRATELEAPRGATVSLDFRMALGAPGQAQAEQGPTFGVRMGIGRTFAAPTTAFDARGTITREVRLADFRFDTGGSLARAEVASFDLANLDRDPRLSMSEGDGKDSTTWIIIGLVIAGAVAWAVLDDDDEEDELSD